MLIAFEVENFRSFSGRQAFDMVPGKSKLRAGQIARFEGSDLRLLHTAAVFGGNAAGKSNLVRALDYLKYLIVTGPQPEAGLPDESFKLGSLEEMSPTRLTITFWAGRVYRYSCAVTRDSVAEESLSVVLRTTEHEIFRRAGAQFTWGKLKSLGTADAVRLQQRMQLVSENTRHNQLFLASAAGSNIHELLPIRRWFSEHLVIVTPSMGFKDLNLLKASDGSVPSELQQYLSRLDTGISRVLDEPLPDEAIPLPDALKEHLSSTLADGAGFAMPGPGGQELWISKVEGQLRASRVVTFHTARDRREVKFEASDESDGTQRMLQLLPGLIRLQRPGDHTVLVVDELDRSLHTLLLREVISRFLGTTSSNSRAQLIFTTHDVMLMDPALLRKDEVWVVTRMRDGSSRLNAISTVEGIRPDLDLRKTYLHGRIGGTPRLVSAV